MRRWRVATALSANDIDIRLAEAEAEYERRNPRSRQLFERGARSLPGGNTRTGVNFAPFPLYADRGEGVHLYDLDGHRHVDFVNNATALILGHAHPQVVAALQRQLARGTAFSRPTELEVEMAELLRARMPALEKLRFCSSGTEAVLNVLRAARAFTGRGKTAKFEGAYHGIDEQAMVSYQPPLGPELGPAEQPASVPSSEGLSPSAVEDVVVLPFNDGDACAAIIERHADELAAVIVDPLSTAAGLAVPEDGFLSSLREITERHGTQTGHVVGGVVGEAHHVVGEGFGQLHHGPQANQVGWSRIEVGGVQEGHGDVRLVEDLDRASDVIDGVHPGAHYHWSAEAGHVSKQREVVALTGADLERLDLHPFEAIRGGTDPDLCGGVDCGESGSCSGGACTCSTGNNTYTGNTTISGPSPVSGAVLNVQSDTALGAASGSIDIESSGVLELEGGVSVRLFCPGPRPEWLPEGKRRTEE